MWNWECRRHELDRSEALERQGAEGQRSGTQKQQQLAAPRRSRQASRQPSICFEAHITLTLLGRTSSQTPRGQALGPSMAHGMAPK